MKAAPRGTIPLLHPAAEPRPPRDVHSSRRGSTTGGAPPRRVVATNLDTQLAVPLGTPGQLQLHHRVQPRRGSPLGARRLSLTITTSVAPCRAAPLL
ncbi:hypothetical protein JYU34_006397 [Plutella xylostella]|uniref:Uncharacterized protein n=1 Tax=Plutella xylostella TaxID=51655 RepID=A0ABQ7QRY8_PLUXY|nr:hypothetical protein JYU34_006397 [Plutella xylostella]